MPPRPRAASISASKRKPIPHEFVLDELSDVDPYTKPIFGSVGVYVGDKIVFILRDKSPPDQDNGVWLATTKEHHASLLAEFPSMRSIMVFGGGETGWQLLPVNADDFEESVQRACELVRRRDGRIGKVPARKKSGGKKAREG